MSNLLTKILGDKKEWKAMEARAAALPRDYRIVYRGMKSYLWKFSGGDGMDTVVVLKEVLRLFETSTADGRSVLEVTGQDIGAFCDERLISATSYMDNWRASLNRDVAAKLAE